MRPQHMLLAALLCVAGIAFADPILPGADATATTAAIQAAIDAAVPSQGTVTLGAGLFEIDSQLMVTGGVTLAGQGWESTVIKQVATTYSENTRVVTVSGGAKVERVTLTGGRLAGTNDKSGGGAYVSDGTLSWCCITNNSVSTANVKYGGGVGFSHGAGGQVDHCVIADNSASTSTGNEVGGGGIGAYQPLGPITIDSCLISGNRAIQDTGFGKGGGIAIEFVYQPYSVVVRNTTIVGNAAGEGETASKGGAVFTNNDSGKKFAMLNCVVAGNTTAGAATTVSLNYDGGVDYCFFDVEADKIGSNSLYGDPQFVDAADGDYRLSATSPAREAGLAYDGIGVDLDGVDFGVPPSMGCYEAGGVAKVKSPAFFPASGTRFYPSTNVTISCETDGAAIYYTLDGSDPTDSSTLYTAPIVLSTNTTVKARAYKADMAASDIVSATYTYRAPAPGPDGFRKCIEITLATNLATTAITTGLPALVRLSESAVAGFHYDDFTLPNGGDMMFVDENGDPLPHEVDTWDETGKSLVWVKLPSTAAGTTIALYYGSDGVSPVDSTDVWTDYVGVWHFDAATADTAAHSYGLYANSTSTEGIDGHIAQHTVTNQAGRFGKGFRTNDSTGMKVGNYNYGGVWVNDSGANSPIDGGENFTISGWFKHDTFDYYYDHFFYKRSRSDNTTQGAYINAFAIESNSNTGSNPQIWPRGSSGNGARALNENQGLRGTWAYLTFVYNGSVCTVYKNGESTGWASIAACIDNDAPLVFGNNCNIASGDEGDAAWNGWIDEVRFSKGSKDAAWVAAEYAAMNASATDIFTYGAVQEVEPETKVRNPVFSPASGTTFTAPITVKLVCATAGAEIYYTLDGSDPSDESTLYAGPFEISATTTVKARAYKQDLEPSAVVSATYTYEAPLPGLLPVEGDPAATRQRIQDAIDAAAPSHGTVMLSKGLFEIDAQLMVTSGVTLVGQGWEDTVIRQTAYGRDTRVATVDGGAAVERVTLTGGNIAQVTLNGKASANWKNGAGAYVADGTISWCCISNNVSRGGNDNYGGGVFILKGRIDHSVVADNRVSTTTGIQAFGGGIAARHLAGPVVIESCLVRGNSVVNNAKAGFGGGIAVEYLSNDRYTSISVRNTTIVGNSAGEDGGTVAAKGGAVFTTVNSQPDGLNGFSMIDCIVADNATAVADAAMSLSDTRAVDWCLFDVAADAIGANSLVGDPAFVGAADDDYRLTLESPAVGSGESYEGLGTDLAGADFSDPPSMGCYEYGDLAAKPVFDPESGTEFILSTNVAIVCATTGATIYYTTDGSRPTTSSAVYNGAITVSERTTIKARAYAEGVGPSAIATAVFSDGTIPLEPIVLGEPVSRPGRDFNGSVITVDFTGDIPEGAEPTAKVTIDGVGYPGTVDAEHGTVTIVVPATAVTAGNTYSATVTLTVDGVDYTRTTTLEQGRPAIEEAQDWIYETASTFGETGSWSGEKALVAGEAIAVSNATFTAATAAPSNAVVTIRSTFSFGDASDDAFETSSRAGITVVPVDGVARYAVLTADGAATNLSVVANTASAVAVEIRIDGAANTVAYSVDGVSLGSYPMAAKEDGVSTMHYDGATDVTVLEGSYYLDWLDTNVARAGDTEYPTVEEAVRSGKEPVELLWDASWDPTTPGSYTITTNGYDLVVGGDLASSVVDNGDGTVTVTVSDDTVHVSANSITVGATTVLVGVEGIKAGHWYALEKTTDLAQDFVLDDSTWTSAADLLAGTGELEIALGEDEPCAFYQIRESETAPAVP